MSLIKAIAAQLGISANAAQNFVLTAAAQDGTMKLARGNNGSTTQDIATIDAAGFLNAIVGLQKAGSLVQALSDFTGANQSLSGVGFQKLPGGLILQWGSATTSGGGASVTFPITFPSGVFAVVASVNAANVNKLVSTGTFLNSGFPAYVFQANSNVNSDATFDWFALGR